MDITISEIAVTPMEIFKIKVKEKIQQAALEYLNKEKSGHSKVLHISHLEMEMQDYLKPNQITIHEAKAIFQLRCRMLDVRVNFSGSYTDLNCPLCKKKEDSQKHLLECEKLVVEGEIARNILEYNDLFGEDLNPKIEVARIILSRYKNRKKIMRNAKVPR